MKYKSLKSLLLPLVAVVVSFGLLMGCNDKKSNNNNEMMADSNQTAMSQNNTNPRDNNMNGGSMNESRMNSQSMTYHAMLKGSNEVPSNNSNATGTVTVTVMNDSIHVSGQFSDLSTTYKASHIHMGAKGKNGDVIQPLDPDVNSNNKSGSFDESYTLDSSQMQAMKNGMLYVNVHSQKYPKGEIRGQLVSSEKMMNNSGSMNDDTTMSH